MADSFVYEVTRIRVKENSLLTDSFMKQLAEAPDYDSAVRMLRDKGWDSDGSGDMQNLLTAEEDKTWDLVRDLLGDKISALDVFLYENDYLNLKSAVKETKVPDGYDGIYVSGGSISVDLIRRAVRERDFSLLPEAFGRTAEEALDVFLRTGDGQLSDILIDRAALHAICLAGRESRSDFLKLYAEITTAGADIKTALRASRTGKKADFYKKALEPIDSLDIEELTRAGLKGPDEIASYLDRTVYSDGADAFRKSMSFFEKWIDDELIEKIRPQKYNPFGIEPIAAFVLGRESEIKSVRIILSGKYNHLPDSFIAERVRKTYA